MSQETAAPVLPPLDGAQYIRDGEAEYTLEYPATCPSCRRTLKTVRVIRLLRTRVNFTSTLPRHGRVVICPNCRAIFSAALTVA